MSMKKQDVKELIDQELGNIRGNVDEEFIATGGTDDAPRFLESKDRLREEEAVIDELLMSAPRSQGYYLKLSKEVRPNEFEFKLRIDNYDNWSDIEYEVSNIVRSYTIKAPHKWGSGLYRVTIFRDGGLRGPKHKPIDFFVDAMEVELPGGHVTNQSKDVSEQLASMSGLIESVKKIMPTPETLSAADVQKMISDAYMQGMNNASQNKTAEASTTAALITGMMGMMQTMMQSINQRPEPIQQPNPTDQLAKLTEIMSNMGLTGKDQKEPKSLVEQISEMKVLGLWKEPKDEDPISKITEMKSLMSIISDFAGTGKGERPSTMEKIIDVVGPQLPEMIGKVTGTINNAIDYSKTRMGLVTPVPQQSTRVMRNSPSQLPSTSQHVTNETTSPVNEDPTMIFYTKLFNELHTIISTNDQSKFPYIAEQLVKLFNSDQILMDIATGSMTPEAMSNAMTMYGGAKFKDQAFQPMMQSYITTFCQWVKEQAQVSDADFIVTCQKCKAEYDYPSQAEFNADPNKTCGFEFEDGHICDGVLAATQPIEQPTEQSVEQTLTGPYDKEKHVDALSPY